MIGLTRFAADKKSQKNTVRPPYAVLFVFSLALTLLSQSMRGVMALGGYVASGGPYLITHPAPGWAWIMAPAILLTLGSLGAGWAIQKKRPGFTLMSLAWPALFISLGWNFIEYGLGLQDKSGPHWGDVAAGAVFLVLGSIPLLVMALDHRQRRREPGWPTVAHPTPAAIWAQVLCSVLAVALGLAFFRFIQ